ncbi:MAG: phosphate transport system substrate-binding protein [Lysobacterales bacterium]|jgi:phosphate transport system substrate-binding protein
MQEVLKPDHEKANLDSLWQARTIRYSTIFAVVLMLLWTSIPAALAAPSFILLTAHQASPGSENLAQQLANWRQLGLVADAQLLKALESDNPNFGMLGILEFPDEISQSRWQEVGQPELGEGVSVTIADAMAHNEKTPRNSNESVFEVLQYDVMVSKEEFRDYLDGYQIPQLDARITEQLMGRYTTFYTEKDSPVPWQSLLILEYSNPHAHEIGDDVQAGIAVRLKAASERFTKLNDIKYSIRDKFSTTISDWVELPPPDLSSLPTYEPEQKLKGSLRILGSELKNSVDLLAAGFHHFHPEVKIATSHIPSSEGAIAGLYLGVSDVAPMGDDAKITDLMPYYNTFGFLPTEISVATGGYEKRGSLFAWAIAVNKNNPLDSISVDQIKRVFGGERTGGWEINNHNYKFTAKHAMNKSDLIRSWDQLGLDGTYDGAEIDTFGYAAPGFAIAIERSLFHWSKKWNANYREYVEAKQTTPDEDGFAVASERALEDLESNEFAIGIVALMHAKKYSNIKILAVSETDESEAIALTPENVATRKYPLIRDAYFYVTKAPGQPMDPIVEEFMRYCLSREGQESIVKAGYYYPLSLDYLLEQRQKLD